MHSSRMPTGRSLTVCCSLLPGGGGAFFGGEGIVSAPGGVPRPGSVPGPGGVCSQGVCAWSGWVYLVWGCVLPGGVSGLGGVWSGGMSGLGGVCSGGCLLRGASGPGGVWSGGVVSQHALRQTPALWTEFLTHACENITLAQLRCGR